MKNVIFAAVLASLAPTSYADAPSRVRQLICTDGTTFTGEQVRNGSGLPPHTWRNVEPGAHPAAFTFYAAAVTAPDGTVVPDFTWDHSQGVALSHGPLITCTFIIPEGPLAGYRADFVGFFVP